jgi:hypothetical protein
MYPWLRFPVKEGVASPAGRFIAQHPTLSQSGIHARRSRRAALPVEQLQDLALQIYGDLELIYNKIGI